MRNVQFEPGQYYHFYNRGVDHQPIFFQPRNWIFFLQRVRKYFKPELIEVIAYCLMPNHYHFLIRLLCNDPGLAVMQPLTVSYAKAINKQQKRDGHLFQGTFQARLVDKDGYLKWLSRYIHLNPVAAGLVAKPEDWAFSSYCDYIGIRNGTLPQPAIVLSQFPSRAAYVDYVQAPAPPDAGLSPGLLFDE